MATMPDHIHLTASLVVDDGTRAALIALGWTPPWGASMSSRGDDDTPVHHCPAEGESVTSCCGRNPHELLAHRITLDHGKVTCKGR